MTIQQSSPRPASSSSRLSTSPTSPITFKSPFSARGSFSQGRPSTANGTGSDNNNHNGTSTSLELVARMQAKQEAWNAIAAQSRSSTSDASDTSAGGSPLAPSVNMMTPIKHGESSVMGASAERARNGNGNGHTGQEGGDAKSKNGSGSSKKRREKGEGKRKKVAKACLACQKSHLTCDEQRPCTRCVKKGLSDQCVEGVRKKAKYLLEGEERDAAQHPGSASPARSSFSHTAPSIPVAGVPPIPPQPQMTLPAAGTTTAAPTDIWLTDGRLSPGTLPQVQPTDLQPQDSEPFWNGLLASDPFQFGTTASSEYHMLDAMLNSMSPIFPTMGDLDMNGINAANGNGTGLNLDLNQLGSTGNPAGLSLSGFGSGANLGQAAAGMIFPQYNTATLSAQPGIPPALPAAPITAEATATQPASGSDALVSPYWPPVATDDTSGVTVTDETKPWTSWANATTTPTNTDTGGAIRKPKTSSEVYHSIVKPYDYTEGYHFLMEYLAKNFEQRDVLKVVRALASFRPSLIALQMPMSEEDEVFLERSFQRTLIELEKLISYSATPTAVWRRTGEIVYANPEFCQMTGRSGPQLLAGKTYIYLLFSQPSIIGYWENFSVHAFENTTQNFFQTTSLITGDGTQKTCSCCYTIRRDVFDLPSVIIGQFLPIID